MKSVRLRVLVAMLAVTAIAGSAWRLVNHYQALATERRYVEGIHIEPDANGFAPRPVVPPFPALTNAPVIAAGEAHNEVVDQELVLGVAIGDEARAYPINMLTNPTREIINDELGGRAIAATW